MPGTIYRALPVTSYDFSALGASQSSTFVVAKAIDVSAYREADLIVRVHSLELGGGSVSKLQVDAFPTAPTPEDPANDFWVNTAAASTNLISLSGITAPYLNVQGASNGAFGEALRIQVTATQGATAGATFKITVSIDINGKS